MGSKRDDIVAKSDPQGMEKDFRLGDLGVRVGSTGIRVKGTHGFH